MNKMLLSPVFYFLVLLPCCRPKGTSPSAELINAIHLKRGQIISCSPAEKEFGSAEFKITGSKEVKEDFNLAINLLHSFEYEEAEKAFAAVIDKQPDCAMAYWGVAMSNYHPLWAPPTETELKKGAKAIQVAQSLQASKRESDYIEALAVFYKDWDKVDHRTRAIRHQKAMEALYKKNPDDEEVAVFYALALDASADPADKTFANQKKAGEILNAIYPSEPNHPGIIHYIIHTYDYPELAEIALPAARKYASVAPASAHAQHMPSHIFTRLGLWNECISSNVASAAAAKCYAESGGVKGHWAQELHAIDYLVYGYLQNGDTKKAKEQLDYIKSIKEVEPLDMVAAYAFAAIPSRYVLENRMWKEAASLKNYPEDFPWQKFPWQNAIIHFTRLLGAVHMNELDSAKIELNVLNQLRSQLLDQKDAYKANQVDIQIKASQAWIFCKERRFKEALENMTLAADMEDKTAKHPVTPGEVIPARELLGDMLLEMNKPDKALEAYEANLQKHPNRFNALYGAALAAERSGNVQKARTYFQQLVNVVGLTQSKRPEIKVANRFLEDPVVQ